MHPYASDAKWRENIPKVLAVLAVLATLVLVFVLPSNGVKLPWWLDAPSVMGFYGAFHALFDTWVWRLKVGGKPFFSLPDLSGTWAGTIRSSYDTQVEVPAMLYIQQTWTKICVRLETEHSSSSSTMAALNTTDADEQGLTYTYLNQPNAFSTETMNMHRGTGHLCLTPDGGHLVGEYYTGRGRVRYGDLHFQFVAKQQLTREEALGRIHTTVAAKVNG